MLLELAILEAYPRSRESTVSLSPLSLIISSPLEQGHQLTQIRATWRYRGYFTHPGDVEGSWWEEIRQNECCSSIFWQLVTRLLYAIILHLLCTRLLLIFALAQAIDVGTVKYVSAEAIRILLWVLGFMVGRAAP